MTPLHKCKLLRTMYFEYSTLQSRLIAYQFIFPFIFASIPSTHVLYTFDELDEFHPAVVAERFKSLFQIHEIQFWVFYLLGKF